MVRYIKRMHSIHLEKQQGDQDVVIKSGYQRQHEKARTEKKEM